MYLNVDNPERSLTLPSPGLRNDITTEVSEQIVSVTEQNGSTAHSPVSADHENGARWKISSSDAAGARFWKPAVGRLVEVYLEKRLQDVLHILLHLDVLHWRQLLEFYFSLRAFLKQAPEDELMPPPALPVDVFVYIGTAYISGHLKPPLVSELTEPLWYIEAMVLLRLLVGGGSTKGESQNYGLPVPPLVGQFLVHMLSSAAACEFFLTAGNQGYEAAWSRHGGDVLLAMQHVVGRLYPEECAAWLQEGRREPLKPNEVPSFPEFLAAVALQFSSHLMVSGSSQPSSPSGQVDDMQSESLKLEQPSTPCPASSSFPVVMRCLSLLSQASIATRRVGDRFLLCMGNVLWQFFGPAPKVPADLPEPVVSLSSPSNGEAKAGLDIKDLGRMVRTILHAQNKDPAYLAARETQRQQARQNGDSPSRNAALIFDPLSVGSFAGPSEPGDFVPVPEQGPLRRSLAFMEQSALLHVVQSKLCATEFADVVGETEQLSLFALRNISVLWFDLRRCTSTLKQDFGASSDACPPSPGGPGNSSAVLVLRHLRLGLAPDWEAKLASFPYLSLSGGSRVTVKSLVISVKFSVSHCTGGSLQEVDVGIPDVDIQLTCLSTLSQICLSVILEIFKSALQDHIQKQLQKHLFHMLQSEISKWNTSVWRFLTLVVPERLISRSIKWCISVIPPEGLPI
jgi:hypothetical protein